MTTPTVPQDTCCVALELSQASWVCAFAPPNEAKPSIHRLAARDVEGFILLLETQLTKAEGQAGRKLQIVLCYEAGYDGFWLARLLNARGIRTVVFDPASFLRPRRGRPAKTDRLDADGMTRTLRSWLAGDHSVARAVRIPSVEEEDAKRIERERKHLVQQRTRIVARIKGLFALHGVRLPGKLVGKGLRARLNSVETGEGRPLAPFLRREIERMLDHYEFIAMQIADVERCRRDVLSDDGSVFLHRDKILRLARMGGVGETTATVLVAEVFHRSFESRRHLASFIGLAPTPYASGDVSRDRGINKAGTKLARQTLVELAWFWLRYQPQSALARWWYERFGGLGMRARKVGIVALARKLAIALWRFLEQGVVPEGAVLKA